jgi:hypothetical protein
MFARLTPGGTIDEHGLETFNLNKSILHGRHGVVPLVHGHTICLQVRLVSLGYIGFILTPKPSSAEKRVVNPAPVRLNDEIEELANFPQCGRPDCGFTGCHSILSYFH